MNNQGLGLVELIVAMGVFMIVASTGVIGVLSSFSINRLGDEQTEASLYAQEGIEAVRSIKNQNWSTFTGTDCDGTPTCGLSSSGNSWSYSGTSNTNDKFTRTITVEDVSRDTSGNIVETGGTNDEDTKKLTSTVTWNFSSSRSNTSSVVEYISNWESLPGPTFEVGTASTSESTETWDSINLQNTYTNPVVVIAPLSHVGGQEALVRVRNLDSDSFEYRIQEPSCKDTFHYVETVGYIVMESGAFSFPDGTLVEAHRYDSSNTVSTFDTVNFQYTYLSAPTVLTQVMTHNDSDFVKTKVRNVDTDSAEVSMEEGQQYDNNHSSETIGVIVLENATGTINSVDYEFGKTANTVTDSTHNISFTQNFSSTPVFIAWIETYDDTDTSHLRRTTLNSSTATVFIEEDCTENGHGTEVVGYAAFENSFDYP